ncbi:MAG: 16S rRNA (uracil(1498)-N(3))-methyltransferase [Planctomycetes bacterium]|nr:16S rRNA (uracil(1498)-N(3))-methyltransferase [Planctomycetota bacterium]
MNRFFVPPTWIEEDRVRLCDGFAHQICHVLKLHPGDGVVVLDNTGTEYMVRLTHVDKKLAWGEIQERRACPAEPLARVTLFQSLLKRDKFEWVLQKCTEVGVARVVPVITQRTLAQKTEIKPGKMERWRRIMREASEQCARGKVPDLAEPIFLEESLEWLVDLRLMGALEGNRQSIRESLCHMDSTTGPSIGVWVGPEGGFDSEEVALGNAAGAIRVRLGQRTLRTETAAVVACTLILYELKDL